MRILFTNALRGPSAVFGLPPKAWDVLLRQSITMDELRAVADRVHRFEGIGPKAARLIMEEIARITALKGFEARTWCTELRLERIPQTVRRKMSSFALRSDRSREAGFIVA